MLLALICLEQPFVLTTLEDEAIAELLTALDAKVTSLGQAIIKLVTHLTLHVFRKSSTIMILAAHTAQHAPTSCRACLDYLGQRSDEHH